MQGLKCMTALLTDTETRPRVKSEQKAVQKYLTKIVFFSFKKLNKGVYFFFESKKTKYE